MFNEFRELFHLPVDDADSSDEDMAENSLVSPDHKRLRKDTDSSQTSATTTPQPRSMPQPKRTPQTKSTPQTWRANGPKTKHK